MYWGQVVGEDQLQANLGHREHPDFEGRDFISVISWFDELLVGYENKAPCYFSEPFVKCRDCEYKSTEVEKSGFHKCMIKKKNWSISDFDRPKVWEVWGGRSGHCFS